MRRVKVNMSLSDFERLEKAINKLDDDTRAKTMAALKDEFPEHYWFTNSQGRVKVEPQ